MTEENKNQLNPNDYPLPAPHTPFSLEGHFQPWYDDRRDYNTNAPTYYDYLANFNKLYKDIVELLNRVARRNIIVEDTPCIDLTKINDWIAEDNPCKTWHDDIILKADVILSTIQKAVEFDGVSYSIENAIECLPSGLFTPNYIPLLEKLLAKINQEILDRIAADEELDQKITVERNARIEADNALSVRIDNETSERQNADTALDNRITALDNRIAVLETALTKVLTDLKGSGAWSSGDNVLLGAMTANRHIASGNINLFTGTTDGNTFIRTTNSANENDATIGAKG